MAVWNVTLTDSAQRRACGVSWDRSAPGSLPAQLQAPGVGLTPSRRKLRALQRLSKFPRTLLWASDVFVGGNDKKREHDSLGSRVCFLVQFNSVYPAPPGNKGRKDPSPGLQRALLHWTKYNRTLILDFQPLQLWEINVCCLSHLIYGILF